jgi:RimJ/RimL family protein N-acetyltransferase
MGATRRRRSGTGGDRAAHTPPWATARVAGAWQRRTRRVDATQRWFRLDTDPSRRPRFPLDPAMDLRRARDADLNLLAQLPADPSVSVPEPDAARERMAAGHDLWIVSEGDRLAFACWICRGRAPVFGACDGGADIPANAVLLEDSLASPDFRGRGVAQATWGGIADALAEEGIEHMFTKVDITNAPSCRAVEKAGFAEVARMRVRGRGRRLTATIAPGEGAADIDRWLEALAHRPPGDRR